MEAKTAIRIMTALAHEGRLEAFRLLMRRAPQAVSAGEIAAALGVRPSTLSNQLSELEAAGLVASQRAGRSVLYRAEIPAAGALIDYLAGDCCRGRPDVCAPAMGGGAWPRRQTDAPMRVLFVCTRNAARSVMAEAILNRLQPGRFQAFSAGAAPAEAIDPLAAALLAEKGYASASSRPTDWREFAAPDGPAGEGEAAPIDFVFSVCDRAASAPSPRWPGRPLAAHWGVADPAEAVGGARARRRAYQDAFAALEARISAFAALPFDQLDAIALQRRIDAIGRTGTT